MKKIISLIAIIAILVLSLLGLTGCENNKNSEDVTNDINNEETNNRQNEEDSNIDNKESSSTPEEENTEKGSTNNTSKPVAGLGEKYVDLDNRNFAINGKVYTLGVNTLQEMIDDGVPFEEDDIANANNNINKNSESQSFNITLGKYYSAQVRVSNDSNDNMKIADCKLSQVYLPVHEDKEQDIISFAFPLTITEEELVAQAGNPTNESEYDGSNNYVSKTLEYKVDSTKYYGKSGYSFQFVNGSLRYITITYKP